MTTSATTPRARFDKHGRRLPDTGRGCGCRLCEQANAPRYERRSEPAAERPVWNALQRKIASLLVRRLGATSSS